MEFTSVYCTIEAVFTWRTMPQLDEDYTLGTERGGYFLDIKNLLYGKKYPLNPDQAHLRCTGLFKVDQLATQQMVNAAAKPMEISVSFSCFLLTSVTIFKDWFISEQVEQKCDAVLSKVTIRCQLLPTRLHLTPLGTTSKAYNMCSFEKSALMYYASVKLYSFSPTWSARIAAAYCSHLYLVRQRKTHHFWGPRVWWCSHLSEWFI